jgi:hypothetical protein
LGTGATVHVTEPHFNVEWKQSKTTERYFDSCVIIKKKRKRLFEMSILIKILLIIHRQRNIIMFSDLLVVHFMCNVKVNDTMEIYEGVEV